MARKSLGTEGLTLSSLQAVEVMGNNIRIARKRRGWTLDAMAGSMLVTRKTLSRLEAGDPSVGLSVMAAALHVLGIVNDLRDIAAPDKDAVGIFSEKQRLPQRVRKKQANKNELDF
jgi:transcriptional regulator with XRE-family HTH domain